MLAGRFPVIGGALVHGLSPPPLPPGGIAVLLGAFVGRHLTALARSLGSSVARLLRMDVRPLVVREVDGGTEGLAHLGTWGLQPLSSDAGADAATYLHAAWDATAVRR